MQLETTRAFDVDTVFRRIRAAVKSFPPAALFELAEEGFCSIFEQLVACVISVRTRDEVTVVVARRVFERARTPEELLRLGPKETAALLRPSTFYFAKVDTLREIARRAIDDFEGELPADFEALVSLRGIGPKCANLVLGIAAGQPRIAVDVHVHRVTNRWGYVRASNPEGTLKQLEARLPRRYCVEINRLLVPFGKHICTGTLPRCSTCVVRDFCARVGVSRNR